LSFEGLEAVRNPEKLGRLDEAVRVSR